MDEEASASSASYLDFGCGTGDFVNNLAERGWISHGIEPNEKARTLTQHTKMYSIIRTTSTYAFWHHWPVACIGTPT